jgi:hypothetical protein
MIDRSIVLMALACAIAPVIGAGVYFMMHGL